MLWVWCVVLCVVGMVWCCVLWVWSGELSVVGVVCSVVCCGCGVES